MKVLFLTPWYPNKFDAMSGLFVRKHAQAVVRQGLDVHVLYICYDSSINNENIEESEIENVKETIFYAKRNTNIISEILEIRKAWKYWKDKYGLPDIVHLNVITKLGLLALYLKKTYNIPYVITEHWSGYLSENGDYKGILRKKLSLLLVKYAQTIMPVSQKLLKAMQEIGLSHKNYKVVYNVIDDFFYDNNKSIVNREKFRFLHVSCFDNRAKNTQGIVDAVEILSRKRNDFEFIMLGTGIDIDITRKRAEEKGLIKFNIIKFIGEQTPENVKRWMNESDCFVLFSNYETAAVVIEEAVACGLPIITTPVGITEEILDDKVGRLVPICNTLILSEEMSRMIDNINLYDKEHIKGKGKKYSYETIGKQIVEIYNENGES